MADFYQNIVPTFTRRENEDLNEMEASLIKTAARFPIGVIIPALFKDFSSAAMKNIIRELSNTPAMPEYSSGVRASSQLQTKPDRGPNSF